MGINDNKGLSPVDPHVDPHGYVYRALDKGIVQMLVTLRQIVQEVSAATHLDDVLDIIVRRVKDALSIDACAV